MITKIRWLIFASAALIAGYFGTRAACSNGKLGEVKTEKLHEVQKRDYIEEAKKALKQ